MSKSSWSENHINLVGSQSARFNQTPVVVHWLELKKAPEGVREILRDVNVKMSQVEESKELAPEGVKNQRAQIAKEAVAKLEQAIEPAQRAADRRLQALNNKLSTVIAKPSDAALAAEIRAHISKQPSPIFAALALKNDPQTISALVSAPSYLSGLSDADVATLKAQVLGATAEQKEIGEIQGALGIVQGAVKSAAAMINSRAQISAAPTLRPAEIAKA
jgi:hypothetical protein